MKTKDLTKKTVNKKCAAFLLFFFVISTLFSVCYIAIESEHDCIGDGCPICLLLTLCEQNYQVFSVIILLYAAAILCSYVKIFVSKTQFRFIIIDTPVTLKVQMNN